MFYDYITAYTFVIGLYVIQYKTHTKAGPKKHSGEFSNTRIYFNVITQDFQYQKYQIQ